MKRHLIIIDPQRDFCKPDGALYVKGADEDMRRLAAMIDLIGDQFDGISVTLDSHQWVHIAHPIFWLGSVGGHPQPFTNISEESVENGVWRSADPAFEAYVFDYVRQLQAQGRYSLTIWPPHCIVGTPGHAVHDELAGALRRWSEKKLKPIDFVLKGSNIKTEHYSAIQADVLDPEDPSTALNQAFIDRLSGADELVFAGEALDYCVLNTLRDLVTAAPSVTSRLVLLRDASSSISGCGIEEGSFYRGLETQGLRLATTADYLR